MRRVELVLLVVFVFLDFCRLSCCFLSFFALFLGGGVHFCAYFFFPFILLYVFYIGAIALVYYVYIISFGGKFWVLFALFVLFVDICFDEMRERW